MKWHVSIGIVMSHERPEEYEGSLSDVLRELADRFDGDDDVRNEDVIIEAVFDDDGNRR